LDSGASFIAIDNWGQKLWDLANTNLISSLIGFVLALIVAFLWRWARSRLPMSLYSPRTKYRLALDAKLQQLNHQFAKQGIELHQILVPVTVKEIRSDDYGHVDETGSQPPQLPSSRTRMQIGEDDLANILPQIFPRTSASISRSRSRGSGSGSGAPFVVITGDPGSGKTVALRLIALRAWTLPCPAYRKGDSKANLIPVSLTFKQLAACGCNLVLAIDENTKPLGLWAELSNSRSSDSRITAERIEVGLREGRFLVAIDGLDEVDKDLRMEIAGKLGDALDNWPATPFIITCRTEAWRDHAIASPRRTLLHMQPFNRPVIRQFVRRYPFTPADLADGLLEAISQHKHFGELARNPLTLTVLCWWYEKKCDAQLPENRALFYQECGRVLLNDWDLQKHVARGCTFSLEQKEDFLSFVAETHISEFDSGQDIDIRWIRQRARKWGEKRKVDSSLTDALLSELLREDGFVVRPQVLMHLSTGAITFCHRTFMEFYAAAYFLEELTAKDLLQRYSQDRAKWQQVLLFYCGLLSDADDVASIVKQLVDWREVGAAMTVLSEARKAPVEIGALVLTAALGIVKTRFDSQVVQGFGYLLASPHKHLSDHASLILDQILEESWLRRDDVVEQYRESKEAQPLVDAGKFPIYYAEPGWGEAPMREWRWLIEDAVFSRFCEELLLAMLRRPSDLFKVHFDRLLAQVYPPAVIPALSEDDARRLAKGVLERDFTPAAKSERIQLEWIDGLRRARAVAILVDFEGRTWPNPVISREIGIALARCSRLDDFWRLADAVRAFQNRTSTDDVLGEWGWPYEPPSTSEGKSLCLRVVVCLSEGDSWWGAEDVDFRLQYLASARALAVGEMSQVGCEVDVSRGLGHGTPGVLRAIWKWGGKMAAARAKGCREIQAVRTAGFAANVLLSAFLITALFSESVGLGDLGVGWSWVASVLFFFIALLLAHTALIAADDARYGAVIPFLDAWKLACQPAIVYGLLVHLFLAGFVSLPRILAARKNADYEDVTRRLSPSGGSFFSVGVAVVSAIVPIAGLWVFALDDMDGLLAWLLLVLALLNPVYVLTYSSEVTHPALPSRKTLELLAQLSRVEFPRD
jgi:hypothetical protein